MQILSLMLFFLMVALPAGATNYLLNGGQESRIEYEITQKVTPSPNSRTIILNFVVPKSFSSPTYNQKVTELAFRFSPEPANRKDTTDERGNDIIEVSWRGVSAPIQTAVRFTALNQVKLKPLKTRALFPPGNLPEKVRYYLQRTEGVDSEYPPISEKARELTRSVETEFDAVQQILTWVVDHMNFVVKPSQYDATYSFEKGRGNCQNYSHLTAALMRAVGIPVRIVNGVTLKQPYDIKTGDKILTMKMAQSRHSWIEVYFPDLGWVPFDPQGSELFVSNRFIRVEVGIDNRETEKDGLLRWTKVKGSTGRPALIETIEADFRDDSIQIAAAKMDYGPRELLLCPKVETAFTKVAPPPPPPPPPKIPPTELKKITYSVPFVFGNLEFPENEDFLSTRGPAEESPDGTMTARKNFLVETAEYVTTQGKQYSQTFILQEPIKLTKIGLALHKFSDDGQLWIELYRDQSGMPDELIATSDFLTLAGLKYSPGYTWVDFSFPAEEITLSPGRYWAALGFTGSPVVNWFFTYGKPVGPEDGTRYKTMFDETWSRSLSFEFNYRVVGLAAKK